MFKEPAAIHLAVAREIEQLQALEKEGSNPNPNELKKLIDKLYRNWGARTTNDFNLSFFLSRRHNLRYDIGSTKVFILTGSNGIPERIITISDLVTLLCLGDLDRYCAVIIGCFEAANFLFSLSADEVAELRIPNGIKAIEEAVEACLHSVLTAPEHARYVYRPSQKIASQLSRALKEYFIAEDTPERNRNRRESIKRLLAPFLEQMKTAEQSSLIPIQEFLVRELFYCRIHRLPLPEIAEIVSHLPKP